MTVHQKKPTVLVILDGFGYSDNTTSNAIAHAQMPHFERWLKQYPHTILKAAGTDVGLLPGQMGNSEVGHMNIGAGRIIQQDVVRIITAINDGSFFEHKKLQNAYANVATTKKRLHLLGLLSDGGIHSHQTICDALLRMAYDYKLKQTFIHAFLDGRDAPPQSARTYLSHLDAICKKLRVGQLGTIAGRYYAMDRDRNWDRTQQVYQMLTQVYTPAFTTWQQALDHYYAQGITDEFIPPTQLLPESIIQDGDLLIFFNFRAERAQQLVAALSNPQFKHFPTKKLSSAAYLTMTDYFQATHKDTETFCTALFEPLKIADTLKKSLQKHGKTMFTIAETEKYAHVTYFFDGGRYSPFANEERAMIASIPAKTYVQKPVMSANGITDAVIASLEHKPCDFYLINYANADMVAHSGNFAATVKAVECLDHELGRLYHEVVENHNGIMYITSDHGNAEEMLDPHTGQPKTSHTSNDVYFLMLTKDAQPAQLNAGLHRLADVAPFIMRTMGLEPPATMESKGTRDTNA